MTSFLGKLLFPKVTRDHRRRQMRKLYWLLFISGLIAAAVAGILYLLYQASR